MSLDTIIRAVQKKLGVPVDGQPGPETWGAIHLTVVGKKTAADAGLDTIIRAVQKKLNVFVDGSPGPETWGAIFISPSWEKSRPVKPRMPKPRRSQEKGRRQDSRSEGNIATLLPRVRPFARALIEKAANQGIIIKVTSSTRSFAEQDELFAQGRTKPGKRVSNARGGFSNHNFGLAFDVTIFKGSTDPERQRLLFSNLPFTKPSVLSARSSVWSGAATGKPS